MATKTLFYAVRHGETSLNAKGAFRGPLDVPLTKKGMNQANKAGKVLRSKPASLIVHSEKKRTEGTARAIASSQKGMPMITGLKDLQAWNLGSFAGKPKDDENLKKLQGYIDHPNKKVPGGESLSQFKNRVQPVLKRMVEAGNVGLLPIIVAHSSIIHEIGNLFNKDEKSVLVKPGGIVAVMKKGKKVYAKIIYRPDGHEKGGIGG